METHKLNNEKLNNKIKSISSPHNQFIDIELNEKSNIPNNIPNNYECTIMVPNIKNIIKKIIKKIIIIINVF